MSDMEFSPPASQELADATALDPEPATALPHGPASELPHSHAGPSLATSPGRDPGPMLRQIKRDIVDTAAVWVFGYASLIWRPEFEAVEQQPATVFGYHRALQMRSRINRGSPECPGLVFALVRGGSCRGMAYRLERAKADEELDRLWSREMHHGVYDPKWLPCRTPDGIVPALSFTLSRGSPNFVTGLSDEQMIGIFREACGRFGTTLDYLRETARCLRSCGIRDREVERLCGLAMEAGL